MLDSLLPEFAKSYLFGVISYIFPIKLSPLHLLSDTSERFLPYLILYMKVSGVNTIKDTQSLLLSLKSDAKTLGHSCHGADERF